MNAMTETKPKTETKAPAKAPAKTKGKPGPKTKALDPSKADPKDLSPAQAREQVALLRAELKEQVRVTDDLQGVMHKQYDLSAERDARLREANGKLTETQHVLRATEEDRDNCLRRAQEAIATAEAKTTMAESMMRAFAEGLRNA